jgi:hypothetical protein
MRNWTMHRTRRAVAKRGFDEHLSEALFECIYNQEKQTSDVRR